MAVSGNGDSNTAAGTAQSGPAGRGSAWNLPNVITMVRMCCAPIMLWLLLADAEQGSGLRWWAVAIFVVAMVSDALDGYLARSRQLITNFGMIADPIADKSVTGFALVGLSILVEVWWWVTVVILIREIGITAHRLFMARHIVIPAQGPGKAKTVVQTVAIGCALTPLPALLPWFEWLTWLLLAVALVLTVWSAVVYVVAFGRIRKELAR